MKRFKTFVTLFAAVAAMILLPGMSTLKASAAEEGTTYYIDYDPDWTDNGWYVLIASDMEDRDHAQYKSMQFFYNSVRDGDIVVVSNEYENVPELDLGSTNFSNITVLNGSKFFSMKAKSVTDFYVLSGSECSISALVKNTYAYDPCLVNFTENVQDILLTVDASESTSTMGCGGTVGSLKVSFTSTGGSYSAYSFKKGTFLFKEGYIVTERQDFSSTPTADLPAVQPVPVGGYTLEDLFDERYYADRYPDLKNVFGYNREILWAHFMTNGLKEGRVMNGLLDVVKYRNTYADLNAVFGDNWNAYVNHYLIAGAVENRDNGTDFNPIAYANEYADLKNVYGNNVLALWKHYDTVGRWEHR